MSLVSVLIAVGLLGAVSLGVMRLISNIQKGQTVSVSLQDQIELQNAINLILENEKHCRISLADEKFKKRDVDEEGEGHDVELWLSNQAGDARVTKKYSAIDATKKKHGNILIESMKLIINDGQNINYAESASHNEIGELQVIISKKISKDQKRHIRFELPVQLNLSTDASGTSTIVSCSAKPNNNNDSVLAHKTVPITLSITGRDYSGDNESCKVRFDIDGICSVTISSSISGTPGHWDDNLCYNWAHNKMIDGRYPSLRCDKKEMIFFGERVNDTKNNTTFIYIP